MISGEAVRPKPEACASCRFYRANECRHNPPVVVVGPDGVTRLTRWPTVSHNDWCGKYDYRSA